MVRALQAVESTPHLLARNLERVKMPDLLDRLLDPPRRLLIQHCRVVKLSSEAGLVEERAEGVSHRAGERLQVVTTFQEEDAAAAAQLPGQLLDARRQHVERARRELQTR